MVSVSVRPRRSARYVDDGDIVLTNGRIALLADIPGGSWNRQKLDRLANAVQRQMDLGPRGAGIRLIADLRDGDPDKTHALAGDDAWFLITYGGRLFIDGDSLVSRSDVISFTLVDGDLHPHVAVMH